MYPGHELAVALIINTRALGVMHKAHSPLANGMDVLCMHSRTQRITTQCCHLVLFRCSNATAVPLTGRPLTDPEAPSRVLYRWSRVSSDIHGRANSVGIGDPLAPSASDGGCGCALLSYAGDFIEPRREAHILNLVSHGEQRGSARFFDHIKTKDKCKCRSWAN